MPRTFRTVALAVLVLACSLPSRALDNDREQMKGLDEQVQEVKSDVLGISAELSRLEEKLLYPSNTQVAVFIALAEGDTMRLDAVQIQIDGQLVAHYIYSFKELDALKHGGVQRIYAGNVTTGEHKIDVSVTGKLQGGADYNQTGSFAFQQGRRAEAGRTDSRGTRCGPARDRDRRLVNAPPGTLAVARLRSGRGARGRVVLGQ